MFGILNNLAKATISVAVTPVALAADVVRLPVTSENPNSNTFDYTQKALESIEKSCKSN